MAPPVSVNLQPNACPDCHRPKSKVVERRKKTIDWY